MGWCQGERREADELGKCGQDPNQEAIRKSQSGNCVLLDING